MNRVSLVFLALLLGACTPELPAASSAEGPRRTSYDDPNAPEWSELDRSSKIEMSQALSAFPDVKVAYLLKRFDRDGICYFALNVVFDGEPNTAALNAATEAFEKVAPPGKDLEILLFSPEVHAQVIDQANAKPFYTRR